MVITIFTGGHTSSLYQIGESFLTYIKLKLTQMVDELLLIFDTFNTGLFFVLITTFLRK